MPDSADEPSVREATPSDVAAIMRARAADAEWGPADPRTGAYLEGIHHPQQALAPRIALIALDGEDVVGYIAGHLTRRYGCDGEVQYLWVAIERRSHGIATHLLRRLAKWFADRSASRICVDVLPDNARARSFYMRLGATELNPHWLVWEDIRELVTYAHR